MLKTLNWEIKFLYLENMNLVSVYEASNGWQNPYTPTR